MTWSDLMWRIIIYKSQLTQFFCNDKKVLIFTVQWLTSCTLRFSSFVKGFRDRRTLSVEQFGLSTWPWFFLLLNWIPIFQSWGVTWQVLEANLRKFPQFFWFSLIVIFENCVQLNCLLLSKPASVPVQFKLLLLKTFVKAEWEQPCTKNTVEWRNFGNSDLTINYSICQ